MLQLSINSFEISLEFNQFYQNNVYKKEPEVLAMHVASMTQALQSCINSDPGLTYFTARSDLVT